MQNIKEDEDTLLRIAQEDDPLWKMVRKWVEPHPSWSYVEMSVT